MSAAPFQFLLLVFAGWVNRRQREVVEYLQEENRVLREQLGDCRLRFTDVQRRRLAAKGRALGRRVLNQLGGLVTPDTILRWYRELIAKKYDGTSQRQAAGPARPLRCNAWSSSSDLERNHQGLDNRLITAAATPDGAGHPLSRSWRYGGRG